jgi:hypothetical protein
MRGVLMSSGPRGEEPITLSPNLRAHYARQLADCDDPRCGDCAHARGALIAAGALRDTSERTKRLDRTWEPVEILIFVGLLVFAFTCTALTGGRR